MSLMKYYFNSTTLFIFLAFTIIFGLFINICISHFSTQFGKKGHRNAIVGNSCNIVGGTLTLIISLVWIMNFEFNNSIYGLIVIGFIFLICGIINLCSTLRETQDDLITEKLYNITIKYVGSRTHDKMIIGTVNEQKRYFILKGIDKAIAKNIKD